MMQEVGEAKSVETWFVFSVDCSQGMHMMPHGQVRETAVKIGLLRHFCYCRNDCSLLIQEQLNELWYLSSLEYQDWDRAWCGDLILFHTYMYDMWYSSIYMIHICVIHMCVVYICSYTHCVIHICGYTSVYISYTYTVYVCICPCGMSVFIYKAIIQAVKYKIFDGRRKVDIHL